MFRFFGIEHFWDPKNTNYLCYVGIYPTHPTKNVFPVMKLRGKMRISFIALISFAKQLKKLSFQPRFVVCLYLPN